MGINRKKIASTGLFAFLAGLLIGSILLSLRFPTILYSASAQPLQSFSSYEDLVDFLNTTTDYYYYREGGVVFSPALADTMLGMLESKSASGSEGSDYSTTNIQVEGVDEADIVKSDGEYLYVVSNRTVFIIKVYPIDEVEILSQINLNGTLHGIYIFGDKLVIFRSDYEFGYVAEDYRPYYWPYSTFQSHIEVYDITDRTTPTRVRKITSDGSYFNSRMIGNYVYVLINKPALINGSQVELPRVHTDDTTFEIQATQIRYANVSDYGYTFTTIIAINLQDDAEEPNVETVLVGVARNMFVSLDNVYITLPQSEEGRELTLIYRIHVNQGTIESQASGAVPGRALNQFSMDEHGDYFRIATTTGSSWNGESRNHVFVLNLNLTVVGRLENLAPGERIYSARFMGDTFYLVTFRKVDPLFVIDLQNPEEPRVLGELKVTGYSDYLHPYDENHIIGIGKETEAAVTGDFAWYQGVKVSFFDVSDPSDPTEIDKDEIGDRGTDSPILRDHKAFLFDRDKQLLAIPVSVAKIDESQYPEGVPPYAYGELVWQGVYIYNITLDGLKLAGNITHMEDATLPNDYWYYAPFYVKRCLYIGNVLYTVSDTKIKMNRLDTLEELWEITLP
jgi:uncharacterized secreted protein with C-terminal beta-propeller domain